jgi:hypothetical protein
MTGKDHSLVPRGQESPDDLSRGRINFNSGILTLHIASRTCRAGDEMGICFSGDGLRIRRPHSPLITYSFRANRMSVQNSSPEWSQLLIHKLG